MDSTVFALSFAPIMIGIGIAFALEHLVEPRPLAFWKRKKPAIMICLGIWLFVYSCELLVFRRPWFAMCAVLTLQFILIMVSNAKLHSLREPFIYQDFEYFVDAVRHPRFFLPFFGLWRATLAVGIFLMVAYSGMTLEPALTRDVQLLDFVAGGFLLMIAGAILLWFGGLSKPVMTCKPEQDIRSVGFWASLWYYAKDERICPAVTFPLAALQPVEMAKDQMPNIVAVQSESYFDPRRTYPMIRPETLRTIDRLRSTAGAFGRLTVPAWGANTVRTEFSFFSGMSGQALGMQQFNPYRKFARCGVPTLPGFLKSLGYRTVCVHPYPSGYYGRNHVYPLLGIDEFIDIRDFAGAERFGPYVSDIAVAEKVCELLNSRETPDSPVFIFVITMENHGPLHLEKLEPGDAPRIYSVQPPAGCEELTAYVRHLENADRMADMVSAGLSRLRRPSVLCWYGDHVPIMSRVYAAVGEPDGSTDYLIWQTPQPQSGTDIAQEKNVRVEDLAEMVLNLSGLAAPVSPKRLE